MYSTILYILCVAIKSLARDSIRSTVEWRASHRACLHIARRQVGSWVKSPSPAVRPGSKGEQMMSGVLAGWCALKASVILTVYHYRKAPKAFGAGTTTSGTF